MSEAYAPHMSMQQAPAPRPHTRGARGAGDDVEHRSATFWSAFASAPADTPRWMDSATAAWRPTDVVRSGSAG
jgi:hypothetical protein